MLYYVMLMWKKVVMIHFAKLNVLWQEARKHFKRKWFFIYISNNYDAFKLSSNSNSKLKKLIGPILLNTQSSITIKENRFKMHVNFFKRRQYMGYFKQVGTKMMEIFIHHKHGHLLFNDSHFYSKKLRFFVLITICL